MSEFKFKVEVKGVEVKEDDIVDVVIGTHYANSVNVSIPFVTESYIGRIMEINNRDKTISLDCSKEYEAKTVQFSLGSIEDIKVKIV